MRYFSTRSRSVRLIPAVLALFLALMSAACNGEPEPTAAPAATEPIAATAVAAPTFAGVTAAPAPTARPTPTPAPRATPLPTPTPAPTVTLRPTPTPTATPLPTPTPTPTATPTPTLTPTPTATPLPTYTPEPTYTPAPTYTPVPLPTSTPYPTATPYPTPTPSPTPTPAPGSLVAADTAEFWVYLWKEEDVYVNDRQTTVLEVSVKAEFDIPELELRVIVAVGNRSHTFCNSEPIYKNEPRTLNCLLTGPSIFEQPLSAIISVRVDTPEGAMRCERHHTWTTEEAVYACAFS